MKPEHTRQQLDPIGTVSNRLLTVLSAVAAFVFAAVMVSSNIDRLDNSSLALLGLTALGAGSTVVVVATDPYRGHFSRRMHGVVVSLFLVAAALFSASAHGEGHVLALSWLAPTALGMVYFGMAPYRPARELVSTGALATIAVAFLALLQVPEVAKDVPALAVVGVVIMPLLALNFAAAAFSLSTIHSIERWQKDMGLEVLRLARQREPRVVHSVHQERLSILNREVVPFLGEVLRQETISAEDRERARAIADSIRSVMVAEVDRTWLENLVERLSLRMVRRGAEEATGRILFDDHGAANLMSYGQRTALRAMLVAIYDQHEESHPQLEVVLERREGICHGLVSVRLDQLDAVVVKASFGPYIAVMRVVFSELRVEYLQSALTLRFGYEQR